MSLILLAAGILIFLFQKGIIFKKLAAKCKVWQENAANGVYNTKKYALPPEKAEVFAQIEKLHELKNSGAITEEEFDAKKKQLLDKIQ